ncbi:MAG: sporulation protein YqfD [Clostridia bacterium]|nr:sporulation protein YqfD [Clostridia bacterium]
MSLLVKIKNALLGSAELSTPTCNSADVLDICIKNKIHYSKIKFDGDHIRLSISLLCAKKLACELDKRGYAYNVKYGGLPILLGKYKKRWGLMAGAVIIFCIIYLSGSYVWDIRVSGNSSLTEAEVRAELALKGFSIGSKMGARDVDEIANSVLLTSEKIAWMSINYTGNVAYVQIREKEFPQTVDGANTPANIVASRDGVIEYLEVMRGSAVVKERQSVREGDLLISGISENKFGEYRTERALGKVYAVTNHHFSVKIPLNYDKKELSGSVCTQKTLKFFSFYINIFRKGGNLGSSCVKIEREDSLSLFGLPSLPVSIISEMTSEYQTVSAKLDEREASEIAFFELENMILAKLQDADLLKKTIKTEITDNEFLLECDIICSQNIAKSVPISEE